MLRSFPPTLGAHVTGELLTTSAPAPQPTEKINKPQRARRRARQALPLRPAVFTPPLSRTSLPPSAHGRAFSASPSPRARSRAPCRPPGATPRGPLVLGARSRGRRATPARCEPAPAPTLDPAQSQRSPVRPPWEPRSGAAAAGEEGEDDRAGGRGGPVSTRRAAASAGSAPAPLRQWWRPGCAARALPARQLGTRLEATGPVEPLGRVRGGLPQEAGPQGAQLGGGGERPAPTPGPGAPPVPAPPETPRGRARGRPRVAGPPSDRCRRPPRRGLRSPSRSRALRNFWSNDPIRCFSPLQVLNRFFARALASPSPVSFSFVLCESKFEASVNSLWVKFWLSMHEV